MSLRISGKHMDIGDAFRTQITERIEDATSKYFSHGYTGSVTVEKSAGRYSADCKLHLASGVDLQAKGEAHDPVVAFEKAAEHIEKRLRRYKRKLKNHHTEGLNAAPLGGDDYAYRVVEPVDDAVDEVAEDYAPAIIAESHKPASVMTVADAVMQLDLKDDPVFVFRAKATGQINIVYRRADGNIGWVDTSAAALA
jgi:ribosomal subunit interface protein